MASLFSSAAVTLVLPLPFLHCCGQPPTAFHRFWNHCPTTTQIFNNLLQTPTIQIWPKGLELWLKGRSFLDHSGFGGKVNMFQTAFYQKRPQESLVLGYRLCFSLKTPSPNPTSTTAVLRSLYSRSVGYARKSSRTTIKIILCRSCAPLLH